ncbi:MAG: hypothetical protein U1E17_04495 [Geminicoccaceae bacterium]
MSLMGDAAERTRSHCPVPPWASSGQALGRRHDHGRPDETLVVLLAGLLCATTLGEDASLAGFYLVSLANGVLAVSLRGSSIDLMHVPSARCWRSTTRRSCCWAIGDNSRS